MEKDRLFNKWYWNNWLSKGRGKKNIELHLVPQTEINLQWIIDVNVRAKAIRHLLGKDFLDRIQKAQNIREIMNTTDFIKKLGHIFKKDTVK